MKYKADVTRTIGVALLALLILVGAGFAQQPTEKNYDQYLIGKLKDKNIGVRSSAAQLLGERRVTTAVEPLLKMLKDEKCYSCRIVAANALYKIGDRKALCTLKRIAKHDNNRTVRHVVKALVWEMENQKFVQK